MSDAIKVALGYITADIDRLEALRALQADLQSLGGLDTAIASAEQRVKMATDNAALIERDNDARWKSVRAEMAKAKDEQEAELRDRSAALDRRDAASAADRDEAKRILDGAKADATQMIDDAKTAAAEELEAMRQQNEALIFSITTNKRELAAVDAEVKEAKTDLQEIQSRLQKFAGAAQN